MKKYIFILISVIALSFVLAGCGKAIAGQAIRGGDLSADNSCKDSWLHFKDGGVEGSYNGCSALDGEKTWCATQTAQVYFSGSEEGTNWQECNVGRDGNPSTRGCVTGDWYYEQDGDLLGPYNGCTKEFDDNYRCATQTADVYVSGSQFGTSREYCSDVRDSSRGRDSQRDRPSERTRDFQRGRTSQRPSDTSAYDLIFEAFKSTSPDATQEGFDQLVSYSALVSSDLIRSSIVDLNSVKSINIKDQKDLLDHLYSGIKTLDEAKEIAQFLHWEDSQLYQNFNLDLTSENQKELLNSINAVSFNGGIAHLSDNWFLQKSIGKKEAFGGDTGNKLGSGGVPKTAAELKKSASGPGASMAASLLGQSCVNAGSDSSGSSGGVGGSAGGPASASSQGPGNQPYVQPSQNGANTQGAKGVNGANAPCNAVNWDKLKGDGGISLGGTTFNNKYYKAKTVNDVVNYLSIEDASTKWHRTDVSITSVASDGSIITQLQSYIISESKVTGKVVTQGVYKTVTISSDSSKDTVYHDVEIKGPNGNPIKRKNGATITIKVENSKKAFDSKGGIGESDDNARKELQKKIDSSEGSSSSSLGDPNSDATASNPSQKCNQAKQSQATNCLIAGMQSIGTGIGPSGKPGCDAQGIYGSAGAISPMCKKYSLEGLDLQKAGLIGGKVGPETTQPGAAIIGEQGSAAAIESGGFGNAGAGIE